MKQTVLDGIVAIEERAAKLASDAKQRAREARDRVGAELDVLARHLDDAAKREAATYQAEAEGKKAKALAALDGRFADAQAALQGVREQRLPAAVADLLKLLEQRANGN